MKLHTEFLLCTLLIVGIISFSLMVSAVVVKNQPAPKPEMCWVKGRIGNIHFNDLVPCEEARQLKLRYCHHHQPHPSIGENENE